MNAENRITKDFFLEKKAKQEKNKEKESSVSYSSHAMILKYQAKFAAGRNQYTPSEVHEATSLCTS